MRSGISHIPQRRCSLGLPPERFTKKEYEDPWNQLTIDLDTLKSNYLSIKSHLSESSVLYAVLKSDAYGHGIREIGMALSSAGCRHFDV